MSGTSSEDSVIQRAERLREAMASSGSELTAFTAQLLREARALQAEVREKEGSREPGE